MLATPEEVPELGAGELEEITDSAPPAGPAIPPPAVDPRDTAGWRIADFYKQESNEGHVLHVLSEWWLLALMLEIST